MYKIDGRWRQSKSWLFQIKSYKHCEINPRSIAYQKESLPSKESDTKILQSIYLAYYLGIIEALLQISAKLSAEYMQTGLLELISSCSVQMNHWA